MSPTYLNCAELGFQCAISLDMRRGILFVFLFFRCSFLLGASVENLNLLVGETHDFPIAREIWVEDAKLLTAENRQGKIRVQAKAAGTAELRLDSQVWILHILSLEQKRTLEILEKTLPMTLGLQSQMTDQSIEVIGSLIRCSDWEKLAQACASSHCQYRMQTSISPELWTKCEQRLQEHLQKRGLPTPKFEMGPPLSLVLSRKAAAANRLASALESYGIETQWDDSALDLAPMIKIEITVAEVKKDRLLHYGVQWPSSYTAQIVPSPDPSLNSLAVTAEAIESTGSGRVLARPNLLCRSGKDAEFLAGGEFPIKIINFHMQDVVWKKYGVLLKVSPQADWSGRMSISLQTEVSSLDPHQQVDGIPGVLTNRVQSHFDLAHSQTIALSGLLKNEESKFSQGWPWLHDIPILGALFGSQDFQDQKSELVIFVRPEVLTPVAASVLPPLPVLNAKDKDASESE